MFKSKEDLIKESPYYEKNYVANDGYKEGIKNAFASISERIEFYERYENDFGKTNGYEKFRTDYPKMICDFTEYSNFNDWLFHFCFDGVK